MGIYIKGMKIPPNCGFCNLLYHCTTHIGEEINLYIRNICRHPDCPLIEVTEPHGRLIDADKIDAYKLPIEKQESSEWHKHTAVYKYAAPVFNGALDMVKDHAPTVIEAEGE